MVSQATMNGRPIEEATSAMGEHVVNLTSDLISLAELQGQLFWIDLHETGRQATPPALAVGAGACVLLGAIPVCLLGLVETLSERTALTREGAYWVTSLAAIVLAVAIMAYGIIRVRRACRVLNRTQTEFQENMRWIKKAVQQATLSSRR